MKSVDNTKTSKAILLVAGVVAFVIGLIAASIFSGVFNTRFIPFAVFLGFIVFLVYRLKNGRCCSR